MNKIGIRHYFDNITTKDVNTLKPHETSYITFIKLNNITTNDVCIFFDDSEKNLKTAKLFGWVTIAGFTAVLIPNSLANLEYPLNEQSDISKWIKALKIDALVLSGGNNIGDSPKRDLTENYLLSWQEKISLVEQDAFLFNDSIKNNIAFTSDNTLIDEKKVIDSAKQSKLLELLQGKKEGLDFIIGERGNLLSGGQKQRLGIARALYNNSEILVLDEFTSALDEATEREIMREISKHKETKTIILSTHKPSILKYCDRIFDVKNNTIIKNVE